jgi:hypothetical protein
VATIGVLGQAIIVTVRDLVLRSAFEADRSMENVVGSGLITESHL